MWHWFFLWLVASTCVYFTLNLLTYTRFNRFLKRKDSDPENLNSFSVLIPARNEQRNILNCIRAALQNDYPNFEVIVVDDNSTDHTFEIASSITDSRLKVFHAPEKPTEWVGKNWACHQLSQKATRCFLVFSDADTQLLPDALWKLNTLLNRTDADVLSGIPKILPQSFCDQLLLPLLTFFPFGAFPIFKIRNFRFVRTVIYGTFIVFKRIFYEKIGGHERIKDRLADDTAFMFSIPKYKGKSEYLDVTAIVQCKMYDSGAETLKGIEKSLFLTFFGSVPLTVFLLFLLFLIAFVPYLLILFSSTITQLWIGLLVFGILCSMRMTTDIKFGFPFYSSLLQPLTFFLTMYVAFRSTSHYNHQTYQWKGRKIEIKRRK